MTTKTLTKVQITTLKTKHTLLSKDMKADRNRIDRNMLTEYYRVIKGEKVIGASVDPLVAIRLMTKGTKLLRVEL